MQGRILGEGTGESETREYLIRHLQRGMGTGSPGHPRGYPERRDGERRK